MHISERNLFRVLLPFCGIVLFGIGLFLFPSVGRSDQMNARGLTEADGPVPIWGPTPNPIDFPLSDGAKSCRHGTSIAYLTDQLNQSNWVDLGWFLWFDLIDRELPEGRELVRMIRLKPIFDENGNRTGEYAHAWSSTGNDDGSDNGIPNEYDVFYPDFDEPAFAEQILARPGTLWIIGNEMAEGHIQDSLLPQTYAKAYHDAFRAIKRVDPTAQVAVGAIMQVSPARLQYLDIVLETYREQYGTALPADAWTFHAYTLAETLHYDQTRHGPASIALGTDPELAWTNAAVAPGQIDHGLCGDSNVACVHEHDDLASFQNQVVSMRQWMKANGYQQIPLVLTEWGILYPEQVQDENGDRFTYERAARFLDETLTYLETAADADIGLSADDGRLVQRWSWYNSYVPSLDYLAGPSSLVYPNGSLTPVGEVYQRHATDRLHREPEVIIEAVNVSGDVLQSDETMGELEVTVHVKNMGDLATTQPTVVHIYNEFGSVIGSIEVPEGLSGCGTHMLTRSSVIENLVPGIHRMQAAVQGDVVSDLLPGTGESAALGMVGTHGLYMPFVVK